MRRCPLAVLLVATGLAWARAAAGQEAPQVPAGASVPTVQPPEASPAQPAVPKMSPRGWIGVGGRNAFGLTEPLDPDFGVEVMGGVFLLREHLQPLLRIGWTHGFGAGVTVDALRVGGGLAAGGALVGERLWLGGVASLGAVSGWTAGSGANAWGTTLGLSALVLGRFARRVVLGVEFGPEAILPTVSFSGSMGTLSWGPLRFNAGLRLGVILGPAIP